MQGLSPLERFLRLFTEVRAREGLTAIILLAGIFCILTGYYLIKPAREGWLAVSAVGDLSKMEVKAYSSFGQSLALMAVLPIYARLASLWPRRALVTRASLIMTAQLPLFWLLQPGLLADTVPYAGLAFYLWVGIFSVTMVAQFWVFAADFYTDERGGRLFPLIALGGSSGAVVGAWLAGRLLRLEVVDTFDLLLIAVLPLLAAIALLGWAESRGVVGDGAAPDVIAEAPAAAADPDSQGPIGLILSSRYLLAIAVFGLLVNWVNTNGENILYAAVQDALEVGVVAESVSDPAEVLAYINNGTTAFYSDLYFWVNLASMLIQALVVSRVLRAGGLAALLFLTPFVALVSYTMMAAFPLLIVFKVMKIAENSTNYSVNNTAKQVMWLPASPEMLYKAKSTVDTLFVRLGDGLAAVTVFVGVQLLSFKLGYFLGFNILLVLVWAFVAWIIVKEYPRIRSLAQVDEQPVAEGGPA